MNHPKPWLRYVDAGDVQDQTLDVNGMKVRNPQGDKLGKADGFIVDADSGRTYYIVVDAGGWFHTKHFLVPIGVVHLDDDRDALVVPLDKDRIKRFPGFELDKFQELTESDVKRINDDICVAFEETAVYSADEPYYAAWNRKQYEYPEWWNSDTAATSSKDAAGYRDDARKQPFWETRERGGAPLAPSEAHDTSVLTGSKPSEPMPVSERETSSNIRTDAPLGDIRADDSGKNKNM